MADEIRIGETGQHLEHALLVFAEARVPFSFKPPHDGVGEFVVLAKDGAGKDGVKEGLEVLLLVVGLGHFIFPLKAEFEGLGPVNVGRAEEHLNQKAADEAALVANVVPGRGGLEALVDPQNAPDAVGQEEGLRRRLVRHVDKGLIAQNVNDVELAEALGQEFNVLDGGPGTRKGECLQNGGLEKGHEEFGLGRLKIGKEEFRNLLVGLDAEGPEDNEEGHGGSHKGEAHQNRAVLAHPDCDGLDLATHRGETRNGGKGDGLGVLGVRVFRSDGEGVEGLFLLGNQHLFGTVNDEIAAIVFDALADLLEKGGGLVVEDAEAAVEHDGDSEEGDLYKGVDGGVEPSHNLVSADEFRVGDADQNGARDGGGVGNVAQPGLVGEEKAGRVPHRECRRTDFELGARLAADENLDLVPIGVFLLGQEVLENENGVLGLDDVDHVGHHELVIRVNVVPSIRIGGGFKVPVQKDFRYMAMLV